MLLFRGRGRRPGREGETRFGEKRSQRPGFVLGIVSEAQVWRFSLHEVSLFVVDEGLGVTAQSQYPLTSGAGR